MKKTKQVSLTKNSLDHCIIASLQLQGGKMRRGCWDDTEALEFSHIYLEIILYSNPSWTSSPPRFKFLNGRSKMLKDLYHFSQHGILNFSVKNPPFYSCIILSSLPSFSGVAMNVCCISILPVLKIHKSGSKYWSRNSSAEKGQRMQTEESWC